MITRRLLLTAAFFFLAFSLSAQTAAEMDGLLETGELTAASAARFTLGAAGLLPEGLSGPEAESAAYGMAREKGWLAPGADEKLNLSDAAFLVMNAFNMDGGFMYSLFPGPRYAYREMIYRKLIQGRADPDMRVSGRLLLRIIDRTERFNFDGVSQ